MPVVLPKDVKNSLKHSAAELWLAHQDGVREFESWEERFEAELAEVYNIKPKSAANRPMVMTRPTVAPAPPRQAARAAQQPLPLPPARAATPALQERNANLAWNIASWQTTNYSRKALSQFAGQFGLQIEDLTLPPHGGNLWVRTDDSDLGFNIVLKKWGFVYKNAKKGWWWRGI
jgi:hypothetical protein